MEAQIKQLYAVNSITHVIPNLLQQDDYLRLDQLMAQLTGSSVKKSFLVFKHNKYFTVAVDKIAFFHIKFESAIITCLDGKEYPANYSLDQVQQLVTDKQFFRVNRQYLLNFTAIKEVEHYFARKLLINLTFPTAERLLVPKEKVRAFLAWMENR